MMHLRVECHQQNIKVSWCTGGLPISSFLLLSGDCSRYEVFETGGAIAVRYRHQLK